MSCRLSELVLNCDDPEALSRFWCAVLDYVELGREDDGIEIGPASGFGGAAPTIILARVAHAKSQPLRLHLDVNPVDRDQDAELERLLALGARPAEVGQTGDESWHVLQDPEGNEFCLLRSRLAPLASA
ncbi:VOC family protein [Curtobacterium sp. MCSS17_015]|uniref:VOC family protein n=1 Tax=Curtobacterium sp. MCSS17_015 TaxID=2175666 RepID=UPI000DAABE50|nr:VOC family protein [Curtobacterium sp. MCSS17_015]WIB25688.1 VOC family protein [Curtobacterium sp. MCSS17_015]